ncbi:MAG: hypothetical protein LBL13_02300 [Bacteroidales bacterium]|nr:hypothetical protein [Bacteroidales bacterium]
MGNPMQAGGAARGENVLDCFVPRNDGQTNSSVLDCFVPRNDGSVNVFVIHSHVIANAVKQSRRKTLTNAPYIFPSQLRMELNYFAIPMKGTRNFYSELRFACSGL